MSPKQHADLAVAAKRLWEAHGLLMGLRGTKPRFEANLGFRLGGIAHEVKRLAEQLGDELPDD